jgi:hypothetical protein
MSRDYNDIIIKVEGAIKKMIEFSNTNILKNYPLSRHVQLNFVDSELNKKNKEHFESKLREYNPMIDGLEVNTDLSKIEFDSNSANIVLTLRIPHYLTKYMEDIIKQIKLSFMEYYNDIG